MTSAQVQNNDPVGTASDSRRLVVNVISETENGTQGHGVHSAFLQTREALTHAGVDVRTNSDEPADVVHIQTMGLSSLRRLARDRRHAVVTAHIVPDSLVGSFVGASWWLPIGSAYIRLFYCLASELVAVSPEVAAELRRMDLGVPVRFVPNAVDCAAFEPDPAERAAVRERLHIADDAFVALCAGQVQPRKGVDAFIETAVALPDITFVWVGGMPFKRLGAGYERMQRLMADAPSNCIFAGDEPHDRMPGYYAAADCLFFPSLQETFGIAIVEAAAAGLPLVLRDLDTYGPLFGDRYIAAGDDTFAAKIAMLRDDTELRARYAARSRLLAERFDTARLAERLLSVYAEVLERAETAQSQRTRTSEPRGVVGPTVQWALSTLRRYQ